MSEEVDYIDIGYEQNKRLREEVLERQNEFESNRAIPRRFWMKPGEKRKIIFLDETPACTFEYNVELKLPHYDKPRWGHHFTCIRNKTGKDIFAGLPERVKRNRSYMGFLTIIECCEYEDKEGKLHRNVRRVLPMTSPFTEKVAGWIEDRGSIVGCMFSVKRGTDKKSPRIGDDWQFLEKVDLSEVLDADGIPVDTSPADYAAMLKPKSEEYIKNLLLDAGITFVVGTATAVEKAADGTTGDSEEDVPF